MNTSLTYKVLANDTLPELCTEPEVIIVEVHHDVGGSAEVLPNGEIRYTPSAGFTGRVVIAYQVKCGSVTSLEKKLSIIVSQPLSQKYTACENAIATIGFHPVNDITYNWYDAAHNLIKSGSDTLMVTKNGDATQTYYAEPIYNTLPHGCLLEVTLELNTNCGTIPMSGCMTDGTVIWKEDFGGNDPIDPQLSPDPGWKIAGKTDYIYITNTPDQYVVNTEEYALLKSLDNVTLPAWTHNPEDHTYENDRDRGYFLTFDAEDLPVKYYEFEIHDLCPNMPLTFSAWIMNMLPKAFQTQNPTFVDPSAAFVIRDMSGSVLNTFFTSTLPATATPEWKNYSFSFTVPTGVTDLQVRIMNNQFASPWGNNMTFDDLEIRICVPPVTLVQPQNTDISLCEGDTLTLEASFLDDNTFGTNLVYQWEHNITGNPTDWTVITGSEGVSTNSQVNNIYSFLPIMPSDSGYYRFVVSTPGNVGNKNCCAISKVVRVRVSAQPKFTIKDTTLCGIDLKELISDLSADAVLTFYHDSEAVTAITSTFIVVDGSTYYVRAHDTLTGCQSAIYPINITQGIYPDYVPITGVKSICPGETLQLSNASPEGGVWSLPNSTIAEMHNPTSNTVEVKGLVEGKTFISFTIGVNCTTVVTAEIKVVPANKPDIMIGF
jgi:hypothetical protein